ncbi:MAG: hypothetical protein JKX73_02050 [Flavobacteriales bacterium]|nr:hypothetical protein [Flavobacteriales bacterium]
MKSSKMKEPNLVKWGLKFAASAGLAGMICCVAPAVLFMLGLMGGVYAISFADFFYAEDGSAATGAWLLRGIAVIIGIVGVVLYKRRQDQCSVDPKRKKKNLILLSAIMLIVGIGLFLSLESLSSWYFGNYIVPAQQNELGISK